jgi:hypothetical protein
MAHPLRAILLIGTCLVLPALGQEVSDPDPPAPAVQPAEQGAEAPGDQGLVLGGNGNESVRQAWEARRRAELEARRAVIQARASDTAGARRDRIRTRPQGPTPAQIVMSRMGPQWYTFGGFVANRYDYSYFPYGRKRPIYLTTQPIYVPVPYYYQHSGFYYSTGY